MSRPVFALIFIAITVIALLAMWLGWRARARRDSGIGTWAQSPAGEVLASFARVLYVSTTPVGQPLTRVAVRGLKYRGQADIDVHSDGVTLQVDGEQPVHFSTAQLRGSGLASRRVGKAVEHGGLAIMRWTPLATDDQPLNETHAELESSFRFVHKADQKRFFEAIEQISQTITTTPPQEDQQ